jgi:hypothetical protein
MLVHVGPARNANVRASLLSIAMDDDQRRVDLGAILERLGWRPSQGQRVLAGLALTRGQARAAIVGLSDEEFDEPAGPGEWAVRQAFEHVLNNERQFRIDAEWAVKRLHSSEDLPVQAPGERAGSGALPAPIGGGLERVLEALEGVRDETVALIASLTDDELAAPTVWAGMDVDVRYLAVRRAAHEREHTVQIHKTLQAIGRGHSEAELILAQAEVARGSLEGTLLGLPDPLFSHSVGDGLPTIEQMLIQAQQEEKDKASAILGAIASAG